jgi:hypothetical protein
MSTKIASTNYEIVSTNKGIESESNEGSKNDSKELSIEPLKQSWWTRTRVLIAIGLACVGIGLGVGLGIYFSNNDNPIELDMPYLKPPVYAASPEGLKGSRRILATFTTSAATAQVKTKLFGGGTGDFTYRLGMVDDRLQELKERAKESRKLCLTTTPELFSPELPNGESFPMYFSCKEDVSDDLSIYFGQKDGTYYLAELQEGGTNTAGSYPSIAVLASVDSDGNNVDVWQIIVDETASPKTASVFHINADETSDTIQLIAASTNQVTGVGCGIKMSSSSAALWIYGNPSDNSPNACPTDVTANDYTNSVVAGDWQSFCVDPELLTDIISTSCLTMSTSFPLTSFSYAQLVSTSYADKAYNLIFDPTLPSGLVDFNEVDE